jgi:hypothetical protein
MRVADASMYSGEAADSFNQGFLFDTSTPSDTPVLPAAHRCVLVQVCIWRLRKHEARTGWTPLRGTLLPRAPGQVVRGDERRRVCRHSCSSSSSLLRTLPMPELPNSNHCITKFRAETSRDTNNYSNKIDCQHLVKGFSVKFSLWAPAKV